MNRSAVTSPNLTPLPLRSINHCVFHFFFLCAFENLQREYWGSLCSFSLFYRQKRTKQSKRQLYRNTQKKQCGEEAQKETIRLRSFPFRSFSVEYVSWFWGRFWVGWSVGWKKITRNLRTGGMKHQHHCRGAWKQQDMVTKSTQTQCGKCDGQFHKKKAQNG